WRTPCRLPAWWWCRAPDTSSTWSSRLLSTPRWKVFSTASGSEPQYPSPARVGTKVPTSVNILSVSSSPDEGMRLAVAHDVMSEHETDTSPQQKDWEAQLIRDLGRWTRRVREFLGYSQDKLAKLADVSQGAVSRVEAGRGKATPLLTFTKINQVFAKALSEIDSSML